MANRLKPAGGKPPAAKKPKKAATVKAAKPKGGKDNVIALDKSRKNVATLAEAQSQFEEIFELHRELGEVSGAVRKRIGDQYKTTAKKIGLTVKATKHLFKLEKFRRENEAAEKEFDGRDRDGFMLAAQIFGDLPFGQFALAAAGRAKTDGFGGGASNDTGPDAEADDE